MMWVVGGWWAKVGEVLCRRHEKKKEPSRGDKAETASLHLSTKRLIIKLQNVDREQMRKVKQIDKVVAKFCLFSDELKSQLFRVISVLASI